MAPTLSPSSQSTQCFTANSLNALRKSLCEHSLNIVPTHAPLPTASTASISLSNTSPGHRLSPMHGTTAQTQSMQTSMLTTCSCNTLTLQHSSQTLPANFRLPQMLSHLQGMMKSTRRQVTPNTQRTGCSCANAPNHLQQTLLMITLTGPRLHRHCLLKPSALALHGCKTKSGRQLLSHWSLPTIDINTLNPKQRAAYNIVYTHFQQHQAASQPLHMIICGTAGTGKSYLISAISNLLCDTCLLTGTTGMAAYHIYGGTLHSTLQIPVTNNIAALQGNALQRLQTTFDGKRYVITNEMSHDEATPTRHCRQKT